MRAALALAAVALAAATTACRPAIPAQTTSLRMAGPHPDAIVTIDDQELGTLSFVQKRGVALPPGPHRITVESPGYFPFDRLVEAREGDRVMRVDVELEPIPE